MHMLITTLGQSHAFQLPVLINHWLMICKGINVMTLLVETQNY